MIPLDLLREVIFLFYKDKGSANQIREIVTRWGEGQSTGGDWRGGPRLDREVLEWNFEQGLCITSPQSHRVFGALEYTGSTLNYEETMKYSKSKMNKALSCGREKGLPSTGVYVT